jgi:hypothetical protein
MKKAVLIFAMFLMGGIAMAQTSQAPKLPDGIEKGLSITYSEIGELIFVTKKKSIYADIEQIKLYIEANYRLYYASAPEVRRERNKWVLTFKKK